MPLRQNVCVHVCACVCMCVCARNYEQTCTKCDGFYVSMCHGTPPPFPHWCLLLAKCVCMFLFWPCSSEAF